MFIATFNNVSVIFRTCAIGRGVQEAHICLPLSKLIQSFTTPLL
jgi:hypothetical protein